jgi:hypothetical protein
LVLCPDAAQAAAMDGSPFLLEWTAARLDVSHDTAGRLLYAAKGREEAGHGELIVESSTFNCTSGSSRPTLSLPGEGAVYVWASVSSTLPETAARHCHASRRSVTAGATHSQISEARVTSQYSCQPQTTRGHRSSILMMTSSGLRCVM